MFSVRAPYVAPIVARSRAGARVGAPACVNESSRCAGDRPAGAVTTAGSIVLVLAPVLGAALGCALLKMPVPGAAAFAAIGAVAVLNPASAAYGMRREVCCTESGRWEERR